MRKALVAVAVVAMVASAAFAGVLVVPKFNDGGPAGVNSSFFPSTLNATYISIHNNSTTAKTITVNYYTIAGASQGTATLSIAAHGIADWRPTAAVDSPTPALSTCPSGLGSATITYDSTDGHDMFGRVFVNAAATTSTVSFSLSPVN